GRVIPACERPCPRSGEELRSAFPKSTSLVVERAELAAILKGLLEVVAADLLGHDAVLPAATLEPLGKALVQCGTQLLRDAAVGGVADQAVAEAERVFARRVRLDELLSDERHDVRGGRRVLRREREHVAQ